MPDVGLIAALAATGIPQEDASDMVDRVMSSVLEQLNAGKAVRIEGVGVLRAPRKVVSAGFPPRHLREQRKVALQHGAVIEKSEPYPDPNAREKVRSTYGRSIG